jgi:tetratricopeptide (TPR) repeat protein
VKFFDWLQGKTKPTNPAIRVQALIQEGYMALQSEDYEKASNAFVEVLRFRDILKSSPLLEWVLMALDSAYLLNERFEEEIMFFSEYLVRYPRDLSAFSGRAAAFWYLERRQQAINDYTRVLEATPKDLIALSGRGQVFAEMGNSRAALEDLDAALRVIESGSAGAASDNLGEYEAFVRRGRGDALASSGDQAAAMEELDRSLRLSPENAWAFYSRAQLYDKMGEKSKAADDYAVCLKKKGPKLNPARRDRAQAWLQNL